MSDALTPDPNAPARAPVPRATAAELTEPGFYFVDFGPGLPVAMCEVFTVNVSTHPGTSPRETQRTPTPAIRVMGEHGHWSPASYIGNFRPRRVKRIKPGVDTFAPDRTTFRLTVKRGGATYLVAQVAVIQGETENLAAILNAVERQANGTPGTFRVWISDMTAPGNPAGPVEYPAPPTGTPERGETPETGPEPLPPGARRTGDPADARGDEWEE